MNVLIALPSMASAYLPYHGGATSDNKSYMLHSLFARSGYATFLPSQSYGKNVM